jgi:type I site-specific restriction endonuclease
VKFEEPVSGLLFLGQRGEIKVLMTVEMLKLGYDFPEVETILQNRPIYSRHTYINAVGRIWRYFAGKDYCLIVDRTWNFERYASHNMHTVFNRQYKYSDKEGEQFFTTANKDYLEKNEINYDFRNFLPLVNKKTEFALTMSQLREWKILNAKTQLKKLYEELNKNSIGLKEVIINGIVFYKKDLNGLTVWTIGKIDKDKLISGFNFLIKPVEQFNPDTDLALSKNRSALTDQYARLKKEIAVLIDELNTEYLKNKTRAKNV